MNRNNNRITTGVTLFLATVLAGGQATADVNLKQEPLFLGKSVAPNIMFMIDDSGSMQWESMPEDVRKKYGSAGNYMFDPPGTLYGSANYASNPPSTEADDDEAAFLRSPHNNVLYYDPSVDYKPWAKADGSRMDEADPEEALHNPGRPGEGERDLTKPITYCKVPGFFGCQKTGTKYLTTYYEYDGSGDVDDADNYTRVQIKPDKGPFPSGRSYDDEIQNFANWYSYHRSRTLAARAGIGAAFAQQDENIRVGYGSINEQNNLDGVSDFKGSEREDFFDSLYGDDVPVAGTPLRTALEALGDYYTDDSDTGPWSSTPGQSGGDIYSCRGSYSVLMTDGFYSAESLSVGNQDGKDGPTITNPKASGDDFQYQPEYPFSDGRGNTLADVAMKYWKQDLVTGAQGENRVSPTPIDPSFWQNMVTYGVGFGVEGSVDPDKVFNHITQDSVPPGDQISWPNPFTSAEAKIDDLLHASVNGRGGYFSATNPQKFAQEMSSLIQSLVERSSGSGSSVAANSTRLGTETRIYQARFDSANWTGDVQAFKLDDDGNVDVKDWSAADQLDSRDLTAAPRTITTWNDNSGEGVSFEWSELSSNQQSALKDGDGDSVGQARLDYLRGQQDQEQDNGGSFRNRDSLLGDIVNSEPLYSYDESYGYHGYETNSGTKYQPFVRTLDDSGRPPMIYVGGNDGMLHGLNAQTGKEVFSYVPNSIFDELEKLTEPQYAHQYFVDGSPTVGDVYMDKNNNGTKTWHRILVGTLGNGGQGVFALDITDPANFDPQTDVLWEFTGNELGTGVSAANIVRVQTNSGPTEYRWDVVLANGYNSDADTSSLLVLDPKTGNLRQEVQAGSGTSADPNGLATPFIADVDQDRTADLAYAGDLKGNLWKFEVTAAGDWQLDDDITPDSGLLFETEDDSGNNQPITSKVSVGLNDDGEKVVVFGTGRMLESGDGNDTSPQALYGIIDRDTDVERSDLVEQTFEETLDEPGGTFRLVSDNAIDNSDDGWFVSLNESDGADKGERSVVQATVRDGKVIFVTAVPSTTVCDPGGSSWITTVKLGNGGRPAGSFFDVSGDGDIDEGDLVNTGDVAPTSAQSDLGNVARPSIIRGEDSDKAVLSGVGTDDDAGGECEGDCETKDVESSYSTGPRGWRQVR